MLVGEIPNLKSLFEVFKTIVILLGIPLTLGILTSHFFPKAAENESPSNGSASSSLLPWWCSHL